jgi:hypothetical protein
MKSGADEETIKERKIASGVRRRSDVLRQSLYMGNPKPDPVWNFIS